MSIIDFSYMISLLRLVILVYRHKKVESYTQSRASDFSFTALIAIKSYVSRN